MSNKCVFAVFLLAGGLVVRSTCQPAAQTLESKSPAISFVEYSDFQCPFTAAGQPIVERVLAVYGQRLKYEYRHQPLHRYSEPAARRYEAIRDHSVKAADRFRRIVFRDQDRLVSEGEGFLDDVVRSLGFNASQVARESRAAPITARLAADQKEAILNNVNKTPGYMVDGVRFVGTTSFSEFEKVICSELRKTRAAGSLTTAVGDSDTTDCWHLVTPDWKRLEEIDKEMLVMKRRP